MPLKCSNGSKTSKAPAKATSNKYRYNTKPTEMTVTKKKPKKVLISKKWHQNCSHEVKTKSAGVIDDVQKRKPNKTSVSLPIMPRSSRTIDFCKKCGDHKETELHSPRTMVEDTNVSPKSSTKSSETKKEDSTNNRKQVKVKTKIVEEYYNNESYENSKSTVSYAKTQKNASKNIRIDIKKTAGLKNDRKEEESLEVVQEHYVNKKFADLYDSTHEMDNILRNGQTLDTITEVNEKLASTNCCSTGKSALSDGKTSLESQYSSSICILETDDDISLKRLKEFRDRNYFECHSAKKRVETKCSTISLKDHICSYRLYLNERLFPVAMDDDFNDNIRCVDCHLPLDLSSKENKVNGTIQAKVKLGSETQDMVLLLPIKEPLIIKQKRKERTDDDTVYFGVVQMDQNGKSMFSRSLPYDSLALRYQKGYRQYDDVQHYRFDKVDESDVIVI